MRKEEGSRFEPEPIPTEHFSEILSRIRTPITHIAIGSVSDPHKCNMEQNANPDSTVILLDANPDRISVVPDPDRHCRTKKCNYLKNFPTRIDVLILRRRLGF